MKIFHKGKEIPPGSSSSFSSKFRTDLPVWLQQQQTIKSKEHRFFLFFFPFFFCKIQSINFKFFFCNFCRYAVVSGGNKGIGFGICKQLASHGITVILTARDEKKGLDALEKLKEFPFSHNLLFHQLDVSDSSSVSSLAEFVRVQFGKLDILVSYLCFCKLIFFFF